MLVHMLIFAFRVSDIFFFQVISCDIERERSLMSDSTEIVIDVASSDTSRALGKAEQLFVQVCSTLKALD